MVAGEGTIPEAFGPTWDVLPPDVREAYEQALLVEHARAMLGVGAVIGATQGKPATTEQIDAIGTTMVGLHLSEARAIADTAEQLATQMGLAPYVRDGQTATVHPFLKEVNADTTPTPVEPAASSLPPQVPEAVVEPTPPKCPAPTPNSMKPHPPVEAQPPQEQVVAAVPEAEPTPVSDEPTDEPAAIAELAVTSASELVEPAAEVSQAMETAGQPVPTERSHPLILERKMNTLRIVYGKESKAAVESLDEQVIDDVIRQLEAIFLDANNNKATAESKLLFLRAYLSGKSDGIIAAEFGSPTSSAVQVKRSVTLSKLREVAPPLIDLVHLAESKLPKAKVVAAPTLTKPESAPNNVADAHEVLKEELAILADSLGMGGQEKRQLRLRLDEQNADMKLTVEARKALSAVATKYQRLSTKGQISFTKLEEGVFQKLTGTDPDDNATYPLASVNGMMLEDLKASGLTITQVLVSAVQKINKASHNVSSPSA